MVTELRPWCAKANGVVSKNEQSEARRKTLTFFDTNIHTVDHTDDVDITLLYCFQQF